jgi:hypothetical protein
MEVGIMERNHNHWHETGRPGFGRKAIRIIALGIGGILLAALFALLLGVVVQWLWNWLMPDIFGLKTISYWQAFGLLFLGRLLFGRFGHHGPHHPKKHIHHDPDRWKQYKHFWKEKGEEAADELVRRTGKDEVVEG